jgi:hypothetical protein
LVSANWFEPSKEDILEEDGAVGDGGSLALKIQNM